MQHASLFGKEGPERVTAGPSASGRFRSGQGDQPAIRMLRNLTFGFALASRPTRRP